MTLLYFLLLAGVFRDDFSAVVFISSPAAHFSPSGTECSYDQSATDYFTENVRGEQERESRAPASVAPLPSLVLPAGL